MPACLLVCSCDLRPGPGAGEAPSAQTGGEVRGIHSQSHSCCAPAQGRPAGQPLPIWRVTKSGEQSTSLPRGFAVCSCRLPCRPQPTNHSRTPRPHAMAMPMPMPNAPSRSLIILSLLVSSSHLRALESRPSIRPSQVFQRNSGFHCCGFVRPPAQHAVRPPHSRCGEASSFFRETYRLPEPEPSRWCQLARVRVTCPASRAPFAEDSPDACAMDASWDQNLDQRSKSAANADPSNASRCSALPQGLVAKRTIGKLSIPLIHLHQDVTLHLLRDVNLACEVRKATSCNSIQHPLLVSLSTAR